MRWIGTAAVLLAGGAWVSSQPPTSTPTPPAPDTHRGDPAPPDPARTVKIDDLIPSQRLGLRASLLRRQIPVVPIVVIVPDGASYVEAIARWTPAAHFPVLMDNGSLEAREDIARFVRGFEPKAVVRWSFAVDGTTWPNDPAKLEKIVDRAVNRAWGAAPEADHAAFSAHLKSMGVVPPGMVVSSLQDPAWPAAVALAAGHGQPIEWIASRRDINMIWTMSECDAFEDKIESAAGATGLSWKKLGDDLDALTVCLHMPSRVKLVPGGPDGGDGKRPEVKEGDFGATTDRLGRLAMPPDHSARWAWASQIFGNEQRAAYRAMCALFIQVKTSWVFDGYPNHEPWSTWDGTKAAEVLRQGNLHAVVDDTPNQSREFWRARLASPMDAGLVLINSKGNSDFFELEPGRGRPGDTPILLVPTIVHMVHSWSVQYPAIRETVGGRWMDAGAYAYFGSVHEPFLSAFVPTPVVAARLVSGFAWGAACRADAGPMWRLACFGDPLITLGEVGKRLDGPLGVLPGTREFDEDLRGALKDKQFARAIADLEMLGRDNDAGRLAAAVMNDQPDLFTAEVAAASVFPLARSARTELVARAYAKLDDATASGGLLRDALWAAAVVELPRTSDKLLMDVLRKNLRAEQPARDAADLAPAYARVVGRGEASDMLSGVRATIKDENQRREVDAAVSALR